MGREWPWLQAGRGHAQAAAAADPSTQRAALQDSIEGQGTSVVPKRMRLLCRSREDVLRGPTCDRSVPQRSEPPPPAIRAAAIRHLPYDWLLTLFGHHLVNCSRSIMHTWGAGHGSCVLRSRASAAAVVRSAPAAARCKTAPLSLLAQTPTPGFDEASENCLCALAQGAMQACRPQATAAAAGRSVLMAPPLLLLLLLWPGAAAAHSSGGLQCL